MVGIDADTGAQRIEVVAVHNHVGEGFAENFVLTLVCYRKSIVLYMYGRINKCAETAQDNLNSFPYIILLRNTVGVSDFSTLDCRTRNFDVVNTECRHIAKDVRSFAEHQKSGISEQSISGYVDLFAEFRIIHLSEIYKILRLAKSIPITFQSIEIKHINACAGYGFLCFLAK